MPQGQRGHKSGASREDAAELIKFCHELRAAVLAWLQAKHPKLVPPE